MTTNLVSIVIPHWSPPDNPIGRVTLAKCLESIKQQNYPSLEVMVVNNEGNGQWTKELEQRYPDVKWIHNEQNRLFSGAMNQGIGVSTGEFVLCLNNDVVLTPNFVKLLMEGVFLQDPVGMVCGLLLKWDGPPHFVPLPPQGGEGGVRGGTIDSAGQLLSLAKHPYERGHGKIYRGQFHQVSEVFGVPGACGIYRRAMLEEIALSLGEYFDNRFGLFYEDLELAWRAQKKGWKARYIPDAIAYHARGLTTQICRPRWSWLGRFYAASLSKGHLNQLIRNRWLTLRHHLSILEWVFYSPWIFSYHLGLLTLRYLKEPQGDYTRKGSR